MASVSVRGPAAAVLLIFAGLQAELPPARAQGSPEREIRKPAVAAATAPALPALFRRLPVDAFDNTTEGLSEEEKKDLVARGESEEWRTSRPGPGRFSVVAKRPFSEVSLSLREYEGRRFLEVFTQNEKAQSYSYWEIPAGEGPLRQIHPPAVFRAANETGDGKPLRVAALPADLRAHVENLEACRRLNGEAGGNDPEKRRQIEAELQKRGCSEIAAVADRLERKYAARKPLAGALERAARMFRN